MGLLWLLLVVLSLNERHYGVVRGRIVSKEEDLELERQLKSLNKPPIKTFQVEGGVFDCVSIYTQPALDHPLLKNHKIQMKPTSLPKGFKSSGATSSSVDDKRSRVTLNSIDCPQGTVPIRRTGKEDLIRVKSFSTTQSEDLPGQYKTALKLENSANTIYHGTQAFLNVYNLTVGNERTSSSRVWIENGPAGQVNSLQAGWMVAPNVFGDGRTRLFASWSVDGGKTSCINTFCPGFVQVDKNHALGDGLSPTSTYNGDQYVMHLIVFQDAETRHWWIFINEIGIGYWPKTLLPNLAAGAVYAAWGGLVTGPSNVDTAPMGNGYPLTRNFKTNCYTCRIQLVDASNQLINISEDHVTEENNCRSPTAYGLEYLGYIDKEMGHAILFGGPGGDYC